MVVCPRCRHSVDPAAFCSNCGLPLGSPTTLTGPDGLPVPDNTLLLTNPDPARGVSAVAYTSLIQPQVQPPSQPIRTQSTNPPSRPIPTQQPVSAAPTARRPRTWPVIAAVVAAVAIIAAAILITVNSLNAGTEEAIAPQNTSTAPSSATSEPAPAERPTSSRGGNFASQFPDAPPVVTEILTVTAPASTEAGGQAVAATTVTVSATSAVPVAPTTVAAPACSGEYVVIVGSSGSAGGAQQIVASVSGDLPNAKVLLGNNGCYPFTNPNGGAAALGPYSTLKDACDTRFNITGGGKYVDAYVKRANPSGPTSYSCLCPYSTSSLPTLALDAAVGINTGPYVAELQGALDDLGLYPRDLNDGTFESVTDQAVRDAQLQFGLDSDGVVTQAFWDKLHTRVCL